MNKYIYLKVKITSLFQRCTNNLNFSISLSQKLLTYLNGKNRQSWEEGKKDRERRKTLTSDKCHREGNKASGWPAENGAESMEHAGYRRSQKFSVENRASRHGGCCVRDPVLRYRSSTRSRGGHTDAAAVRVPGARTTPTPVESTRLLVYSRRPRWLPDVCTVGGNDALPAIANECIVSLNLFFPVIVTDRARQMSPSSYASFFHRTNYFRFASSIFRVVINRPPDVALELCTIQFRIFRIVIDWPPDVALELCVLFSPNELY